MKKILMMAAAGAVSLSALAVVPQLNSHSEGVQCAGVEPQRMVPGIKKMRTGLKANLSPAINFDGRVMKMRAASRAGEPAAPTFEARYMDTDYFCFYVGTTPDGVFYPYYTTDQATGEKTFVNDGFGAGFDYFGFLNMSVGANTYLWEYGYIDNHGNDGKEVLTSTAQNLVRYVSMPSSITAPKLTASKGDQKGEYISKYVDQYNFGPNLATFGIQPTQIWPDFNREHDYYGVTTCPINVAQGDLTWVQECAKQVGEKGYNADGTNTYLANFITNANTDELVGVKEVKYSFMVHQLPEQQRAYLMYEMWADFLYEAAEDVTLDINICPMDDEGRVDFDTPIGKGSILLPKGDNTAKDSELPYSFIIDLAHVDENGRMLDEPIPVYGACAVVVKGVDNENLKFITPLFNNGTEIPYYNGVDIYDYYFPTSSAGFDVTLYEKANPDNTKEGRVVFPVGMLGYGSDPETMYCPTDFNWNYNVIFPFVMNENGENHFEVVMPNEGGEETYLFESLFPVAANIEDGTFEVEVQDGDWFTYEFGEQTVTAADGEHEINACEIKAEPLPAGMEGRCGIIKVRGFAQDFNLFVGQGEYELPAGIQQVANVPTGKAQYYDLQGRSIKAAPAKGIYIERIGNKATKKIAK